MPRRAHLAPYLVVALSSLAARADAAGAWVSSGALTPIEQRLAVAVGPARTTVWTSLRFDAAAGAVGIVVPVPPGTSLDLSTDAWFEALEVATAPRIFPPGGVSPYCPGVQGPMWLFDIAGEMGHVKSLPVDDVSVLDDASAVSAWASQSGLALAPDLEAKLGALAGSRFVAVRFQVPGGSSQTPTLRIAMPGAPPMLPLALTRAGGDDLRVTAWTIGEGRVALIGSAMVTIPPSALAWNAKTKESTYEKARAAAIAAEGADGAILECASPKALSYNLSIADGSASVDGVVTTFFERAAAYGDATGEPSSCIAQAALILSSSIPIGSTCPRADLGVVDGGAATCVESAGAAANKLRCGGITDDLAVALDGLAPAEAWLSRETLHVPAGMLGSDWYLTFQDGTPVLPVLTAKSIDMNDCGGSGSTSTSGSGTSSSTGSASSTGSGHGSPGGHGTPSEGSGNSSQGGDGGATSSGSGDDTVEVIYEVAAHISPESCDCSGTTDTAGDLGADDCDGSSVDSVDEGCDGGDAAADSCSGDSVPTDSCDGGEMSDMDCSGMGDIDCTGGAADCSVRSGSVRKRSSPKLSVMTLVALALAAPLRRRGRRSALPSARR